MLNERYLTTVSIVFDGKLSEVEVALLKESISKAVSETVSDRLLAFHLVPYLSKTVSC